MHDVALVTGASSGIGEATARELLRRGFTVYAAARRADRMADVAAEGARTLAMDVTDDRCHRCRDCPPVADSFHLDESLFEVHEAAAHVLDVRDPRGDCR